MKKTKLILSFLLILNLLVLFSCRKEKIPEGKEIYIGEWYCPHYDQTIIIKSDGKGSFETESRHHNGKVYFTDNGFEISSTFKTDNFKVNSAPSGVTPGYVLGTTYSIMAIINGGDFYKKYS
jgi:hypothetical protein